MDNFAYQCFGPAGISSYYIWRDLLPGWCQIALASPSQATGHSLFVYAGFFGLTIALESLIYLPCLTYLEVRARKATSILLATNTLSHPLAFFAFPLLGYSLQWSYAQTTLCTELFVVGLEFLIIRVATPRTMLALGLATAANLFSWTVGLSIVQMMA